MLRTSSVKAQASDSESSSLSIVIPSYNTKDILINCIRSIEKNSFNKPLEIIVIDDCSVDGSVEAVKMLFPNVIIDRNVTNTGFVRTANKGIRISTGHYVLVLNSDTLLTDDTLTKMIDFMKRNPECGIGGCKICYPEGNIQYECARGRVTPQTHIFEQLGLASLFPQSSLFGKELLSFWDHADSRAVDILSGAFMMFRRECLDEIGLFDEAFGSFFEDVDICYRAKMAGWQVLYFADTQITHLSGQSFALSEQSLITTYISRYIFFRKYYPAFPADVLKLFSLLGLTIRLVFQLCLIVFNKFCRNDIITKKKIRAFIAALKWHVGLRK
jgi:GT2 family glycosyltransferase